MNNGHHHLHHHQQQQHQNRSHQTNGYRAEKRPMEQQQQEEDPYANLSEFYLNHAAARNEAFIPPSSSSSSTEDVAKRKEEEKEVPEEYWGDPIRLRDLEPFIKPSLRDDTPLANILHPDLDGIDPRIFFKDFDPKKTLRFSRLFAQNIKKSSLPEIYWVSRTFSKHNKHSGGGGGGAPPESQLEESDDATETVVSTNGSKRLKLNIIENVPRVMLAEDEEIQMRRPILTEVEKMTKQNQEGTTVQPWRTGPAKIWYDMMNLPSTSQAVNYGFKMKKPQQKQPYPQRRPIFIHPDDPSTSSGSFQEKRVEVVEKSVEASTSEDILQPFEVIEWEKDVIMDGEEVKDQLVEEFSNGRGCGWIATQYTRTYEHFVYAANNNAFEQMFDGKSAPINLSGPDSLILPGPNRSIFPSTPSDLDILPWEDNVIWDADNMTQTLEPIDFLVDFQDDPLIYGMPEDRRHDEDHRQENHHHRKDGYTKKSKMILGQVQQRQKQEEDEQMESTMGQFTDNDPFNLSNDSYYVPKTSAKTISSNSLLIQHSTPATNIATQFFPTHPSSFRLRYWHRTPVTRRIVKYWSPNRFVPIQTPFRHQQRVAAQREAMRQSHGGGEVFYMKEVEDLSGRDEKLIMVEYSEEHPVILSQAGMASKMKNYFKRRQANDTEPTFEYGEIAFSHQIPFLGQLQPGQSLQSIENTLYRAPIYMHKAPHTDFLLIRCHQQWFIRRLPALFVAGQQCPLYEVPSPNSKRASLFVRDFLFSFIYRLFWASEHSPRRLKMEDVRNAFPHYAESNIRKRLKMCSTFTRQGAETYWLLKPDFRLPSKEEVLAMVTPEMCCAQYSMMAAEQRLKDAGYGEKYFFTPENDEGSDDEVTIEDEIKCAPWNTTRAFLASQREKCLLDQTGIADPTGCGQGFSYVRVSQKPHKDENATPVPKKLVTGTNADLRKLPLKEAKEICRGYGVKEEEISALTRWEIIDVIRTLSTQAAKATKEGETVSGMARFARGNTRFSSADMQEKYRKHCQRLFDLQNQTLANTEPISTDDDSTDADSDNEELASRLESMLEANKGKKSISITEKAKIDFETEEREREDLKRMIHGDTVNPKNVEKKEAEATAEEKKSASQFGEDVAMSASKISGITANQQLKIYRKVKGPDGKEITRVEIVTRPQLIEAYTRIRMTRDDTFIQVYAQMDEQYKEEKRKKKRRMQDQIRRMKKNEEKQAAKAPRVTVKKEKPPNPNLQKMRCSACHAYGHMKTNRNCPLYGKDPMTPLKEEDESGGNTSSASMPPPENSQANAPIPNMPAIIPLIGPDGTMKLKFNLNIDDITRSQEREAKLMRKKAKKAEKKVRERQMAYVQRFDTSDPPGTNGTSSAGHTDVEEEDRYSQASGTSSVRNGPGAVRGGRNSSVSSARRRHSMMPEEDYLQGPVKANNRMRADPKVVMGTMLTDILNDLKSMEGSDAFLFPVNGRLVTDYYRIIKNPISFQDIRNKIASYSYMLRIEFLADIKLMHENSKVYNGENSVFTVNALEIFKQAGILISMRDSEFMKLEKQINPLLDSNDEVGFRYVLDEIIQRVKNIPKSAPFHTKVDGRRFPTYYVKVPNPIDLGTIEQKNKRHEYNSIKGFMDDMRLLLDNSRLFNGDISVYTVKAREIWALTERLVQEKWDTLTELEKNINPEAAAERQAEERRKAAESEGDGTVDEDTMEQTDEHPSEEDEDMDDDLEEEMELDAGEYDPQMWQDDNLAVGQILNDLAMSDSDEDERADEVRRPANEDDNRLDSF